MDSKQRPIETFTCWSAILMIVSGCTGGLGCFGYSKQRFKEICEGRTIELQPHTDSAYQVILKNCLNNIESESAHAIKSKKQYDLIIDEAKQDELLRKKYESEKGNWEAGEARKIKEWQFNPIYSGGTDKNNGSEYNLKGIPPLNFIERATYSSYTAWLEKKVVKKEVEATGWNSIAEDMKVFAEEPKCKKWW